MVLGVRWDSAESMKASNREEAGDGDGTAEEMKAGDREGWVGERRGGGEG